MGEGFAIDCWEKNKEFSTPFGAVLGIKNTTGIEPYGLLKV